jgi:hypothetical protein
MLTNNQENKTMSENWISSNLYKHQLIENRNSYLINVFVYPKENGRFKLAKGLPCSPIHTVKLMDGTIHNNSIDLREIRNNFFSQFKNKEDLIDQEEEELLNLIKKDYKNMTVDFQSSKNETFKDGQIIEITDEYPKLQFTCIKMFLEYFSEDMKYIFPLIVYKKNRGYLKFENTITKMIFGMNNDDEKDIIPYGAVSYRILKTNQFSKNVYSVIEILFISVWQKNRNKRFGSELINDIKETALKNDCNILYVEISSGQPLAIDFWELNGFSKANDTGYVTEEQYTFFNNNCLRFSDTNQYIKYLNKN